MLGPTVHELEQCRARNEFLEREHARLMLVVSEQADTIARGRSTDRMVAELCLSSRGRCEWAEASQRLVDKAVASGQNEEASTDDR